MNTQYRKNLKAVSTACKNYTDNKIDDLIWYLGDYNLSKSTDDNVSHEKTVPTGTIRCKLVQIGGMSYKYNQLITNGNFESDGEWFKSNTNSSFSVSNNTAYFTAYTRGDQIYHSFTFKANHKYLLVASIKLTTATTDIYIRANGTNRQSTTATTNKQIVSAIFNITTDSTSTIAIYDDRLSGFDEIQVSNYMCFDLTEMGIDTTDVATATTELLKRGIDINEYNEYNAGTIRDSAVTSVVSKDSNNTTLDTYTIPAEVQALEGYGQSNPNDSTEYNYIDFKNKLFKRKGYIDTTTNEWVVSVLETDISAYLTTNTIDVKPLGTIEFTNTYSQAIPSEVSYLIEMVKSNE